MKRKTKVASIAMLALMIMSSVGLENYSYADGAMKISGKDRYETSYEAANLVKSNAVVIANGNVFADSLSAYNLVNKYKSKLALVNNDNFDKLNKVLNKDIKYVYIVGGYSTLNNNLESKVKSLVSPDAKIERISGSNRYATNDKALKKGGYKNVGVADGRNYPDALAAAGLLNHHNYGLLLVDGARPYKTDYKVVYTFGGKNSVVQNAGTRLYGSNRYETADIINHETIFSSSAKPGNMIFADGEGFADALTSLNLFSYNNADKNLNNWVVLSNKNSISDYSRRYNYLLNNSNKFIVGNRNISSMETNEAKFKEETERVIKKNGKNINGSGLNFGKNSIYAALKTKYNVDSNLNKFDTKYQDVIFKVMNKNANNKLKNLIKNGKVENVQISLYTDPIHANGPYITINGKLYDEDGDAYNGVINDMNRDLKIYNSLGIQVKTEESKPREEEINNNTDNQLEVTTVFDLINAKYPETFNNEFLKKYNNAGIKYLKNTIGKCFVTREKRDLINNSRRLMVKNMVMYGRDDNISTMSFYYIIDGKNYDMFLEKLPDDPNNPIYNMRTIAEKSFNSVDKSKYRDDQIEYFRSCINDCKDGVYNTSNIEHIDNMKYGRFVFDYNENYMKYHGVGLLNSKNKSAAIYDDANIKQLKLAYVYDSVVDVNENGKRVTYYLIGDDVYSAVNDEHFKEQLLVNKNSKTNYIGKLKDVKSVYNAIH